MSIKKELKKVFNTLCKNGKQTKLQHGYLGKYNTFSDAAADCTGYDADNILEVTKNALLKVKNGEAVYERDSVLFDRIEYSWPLLACLMQVAAKNDGLLNVLDFGGSLGSTYYQNKKFFGGLEVKWNIVEQHKHVECGKEYFETNELKFYDSIDDCLSDNKINVVLFGSVLQFLEDPYFVLNNVISLKIDNIIFDRTPILQDHAKIPMKQVVPDSIYKASYPIWLLNENKLMSNIEKYYLLVEDWVSTIDGDVYIDSINELCKHKGYFLILKQ